VLEADVALAGRGHSGRQQRLPWLIAELSTGTAGSTRNGSAPQQILAGGSCAAAAATAAVWAGDRSPLKLTADIISWLGGTPCPERAGSLCDAGRAQAGLCGSEGPGSLCARPTRRKTISVVSSRQAPQEGPVYTQALRIGWRSRVWGAPLGTPYAVGTYGGLEYSRPPGCFTRRILHRHGVGPVSGARSPRLEAIEPAAIGWVEMVHVHSPAVCGRFGWMPAAPSAGGAWACAKRICGYSSRQPAKVVPGPLPVPAMRSAGRELSGAEVDP